MCGISGIYNPSVQVAVDLGVLRRMTALIAHRGPDDEGYCLVNTARSAFSHYSGKDSSPAVSDQYPHLPSRKHANLAMGFRRLAIIDLSNTGHQPMVSADGSCVIVYNGEIYNYLELRDELRLLGHSFGGASDTEVILAAWQQWGQLCVQRFIGMWAFVLWDQRQQCLFCSRDRFGIKPLYYYWDEDRLVWGSEIKSVLSAVESRVLDPLMVWRSSRFPAMLAYEDATFWHDVKSLKAGHNLLIKAGSLSISQYYALDPSGFERSSLSFKQATARYRELVLDSVRLQMRADVEVGSCLSGGLDSSAIVCSAAGLSGHPLSTFSAYYATDPELDERFWINAVVSRSGASSYLVSPTAMAAWDHLQRATWYNDLPVGAGCVSQYAVMQLAKSRGIKVLLDGQGCDEICGGYNHSYYRYFADMLRQGQVFDLIRQMKRYFSNKNLSQVMPALGKTLLVSFLSERQLYRLESKYYRWEAFNRDFRRQAWSRVGDDDLMSGVVDLDTGKLSNFLFNLLYTTSLGTLLHYEDRLSMAHAVESRVPYLDHRLVELCFSLPSAFKLNPPWNKYVHRQAVRLIVPAAISSRIGKGIFGAPFFSSWMRGDLRSEIEQILHSVEFRRRGIWDLSTIMIAWQAYLGGDNAKAAMLFDVIALELWFRNVYMEFCKGVVD